ncbi:MAG: 4-hydroxythreonine-4-phosphate dehydrogenase PdxA [Rhodospirillaceae bacterium]|nr:4-hydroxythreonine-4-phosphate dehydrogenase PdxA [Rhodospirillaceae bacterium]
MGDPSGIGPEIICKALRDLPAEDRRASIVIGDPKVMARAAEVTGTGLSFTTGTPTDADTVRISEVFVGEGAKDGEISAASGQAAYDCVVRAVELAQAGDIAVIVTAPLNKAAMHEAGHHFDGHTGLLAHLTGSPSSFMLLASEKLSTVHVSTHVALADAIERTKKARVLETIRAGNAHLKRLGLARPRIAVAGLNPHCGEGGIFGRQDIDEIAPAVEAARAEGIDAKGPISADTVFYRASQGEFDLVVAQYHDQGHIPVKLIAFDTTVNVSLGLPIQRTSVDHGTAFDIAWTGKADHTNMMSAIAYARQMAVAPPLTAVSAA